MPVIAVAPDGCIVDINEACMTRGRFDAREAIVGHHRSEFIADDQQELEKAMFERALAGETVYYKSRLIMADNSEAFVEKRLVPVFSGGCVRLIYGFLLDLTSLRDLQHDFSTLFKRNPDGVALLSPEGRFLDLNDAAAALADKTPGDLFGEHFSQFLHGADLQRAWTFFQRALHGEIVRYEIEVFAAGRNIMLDATLFAKTEGGVTTGVYAIFQDISARLASQRRVEMQAQRIRDLYLLATAPEYSDAHMMSTLQTGCRLLGMESGALVAAAPSLSVELRYDALDFFSGRDEALLEIARRVLEHPGVLAQSRAEGAYPAWLGTRINVAGDVHGALIFFSTVSHTQFEHIDHDTLALISALVGGSLERRRARTHLRTLAYYDSLTGLPNRAFFRERLRDTLIDMHGHSTTLSIILMNVDRFKDINDSLGHAVGDRFLQMIARRIVDYIGPLGFVARMSGDEFAVLLSGEEAADAARLASELIEVVRRPYEVEGYDHHLTCSAGIASYPDDARDDESLVRSADMAMRQAKDIATGSVEIYSHAMQEMLRSRLLHEQLLRTAIERGDFELFFQPIADLATGRIAAVEALLRWQDPERGTIYPDSFIPVAEASGMIVELGDWVAATASRALARFLKFDKRLRLSINISPRQFHQPDLCDRIVSHLKRNGVPASALEIEITESMTLTNISHALETIRKLKAQGAKVSVDDFGTGHSSLNYLRRFAIDEIKIDKSFIAGIGHQASDETIVKAIIAMGRSLGLCVVAEGVETPEQIDFLERAGCERVQGYYISRPLTTGDFEKLLARGTPITPG